MPGRANFEGKVSDSVLAFYPEKRMNFTRHMKISDNKYCHPSYDVKYHRKIFKYVRNDYGK